MTQEHATPQTVTPQGAPSPAIDPSALTEAELALVVGGGEDDIKGDITVNPKRA
jgi:hypothetical protein